MKRIATVFAAAVMACALLAVPAAAFADGESPDPYAKAVAVDFEDGTYSCEVAFEGGSGKASIESPTVIEVKDGKAVATVTWSSENYDYMLVDGDKYLRTNEEGNSVFTIPVLVFDESMPVVGDTTAMSTPHEIDYTLTFDSSTMAPAQPESSGSVPVMPIVAVVIIAIIVGIVIGVMRSKRDERV